MGIGRSTLPGWSGRVLDGTLAASARSLVNLFGSHSPPLAANPRNERQDTQPLAAGIVYFNPG